MDVQKRNWDVVAGDMARTLGTQFDPAWRGSMHERIVSQLAADLPHIDHTVLGNAVERTARGVRFPIDWRHFLCLLLRNLPGSWVKLTNNPGFEASTMLLLTDGSVMVQEQGGLRWKKLSPDTHGSYVNGTWSDLAPMHNTRRYYASAVLKDGRVFVCGGEYSDAGSETNKTEVYDPTSDTWTQVASPPGWTQVGDSPCAVLPDGRVLLGSLNTTNTAIYDPTSDTWTAGPAKGSSSSEESWVLLPDETVVTVRCDSSNIADKYVASSNSWVGGGTLPVGIVEVSSSEIGAGVLLNDGHAFFAGANNHTAVYAPPPIASNTGTWTQGPDFPNDANGQTVGCKDTPSCLMTNGKVLISAGPVDGANWLTPTYFFEYDGGTLHRVADPPNATNYPFIGRMLLLPTGQILFAAQTDAIYAYSYSGCPDASWRPEITSYPATVIGGFTYSIQGIRFNGMSQAVGYGDDAAAATNYPLVRIRHVATGTVTYCRTFDHSSMGVATGATPQSTNFTVPYGIPLGASEICVVANGISSPCVPLVTKLKKYPWPQYEIWQRLIGSLADGPLWALGPHGPIPVDPWGPKYRKTAEGARHQILEGFKILNDIGQTLDAERQRAAKEATLAPDDDTDETESGANGSGGAKGGMANGASFRRSEPREPVGSGD
jgi:hypothetical protein